MKALIKVGYGCNEHCTFCHTIDVREVEGSSSEVLEKIERARRLGHTMVVLSGGEPTIRPELFSWAERIAALDMDVGLVTNGLVLAYRDVVDRLVASRLRYVYLSLHGGTAKIHNSLVRRESFEHALAALGNLTGRGLDLTVNCVITRTNVDHLRELVDQVLPFPDLTLKLSMVEPKGGGDRLFDQLVPRIAHVADRVSDAIRYGMERATEAGPRFAHGAIPHCLVPGLEDRFSDLKSHAFRTMVEVGEPDYFPVDDLNKTQPEETCRSCALAGPCPGLYRGYYEAYGSAELRPVHDGARPRAFDYVLETLVTTSADPARCPLRDDGEGVTPWDLGRTLFVRNGARIARYRCHSRAFSDVELQHTKLALGQVYVEVPRAGAADGLAKLRRSELCASCPERARCTGLFEPVFDDAPVRDDAHVRALLAGLTGDVLEVSDPDSFDPESGRSDHVLVLEGWNRARDPRRLLESCARALRPGGTLVVVDDVAFGVARARQGPAGEPGTPVRTHRHRNDEPDDVLRIARGLPLAMGERFDVGATTGSRWLVRLVRL